MAFDKDEIDKIAKILKKELSKKYVGEPLSQEVKEALLRDYTKMLDSFAELGQFKVRKEDIQVFVEGSEVRITVTGETARLFSDIS